MQHKILAKVDSPRDLKQLSYDDLEVLAKEIREELIEITSETGGHLAPNLGVVELTIALHRSLDSPKDKIIWDVGHQCYVHKILTGRKKRFATLRQYEGIAGFPKSSESEHDIFDTGHASTSISFALGLAEARDKKGGDENVVAVIGDGSLTGGMAYEALNQAGHLGTRLIIILNDNEMSIASNVGAMSSYLNRIRLDPVYARWREEIEQRIRKIPAIGEKVYAVGESIKDALKYIAAEGVIFEELGISYVGPIDGHDIKALEENIDLAKNLKKPVLIHALTKKGRGYAPAENHPEEFHGTAPFVVKTGKLKVHSEIPTYTEVFGRTALELAKKNKKIVAITAAMSSGTGLSKFKEAFPDRFFDVGIAEEHAVTFSAGLARGGCLPLVAIYSTFLERAYDQIIQDVCLQGLHIIFALDRAGLVGEDGPTHHGAFDISYLRHIPNMIIMAPKDEEELRQMLFTATKVAQPVAIRYPRRSGLGVKLSAEFKEIKIGEAEILSEGRDVCLIAVGSMVDVAAKAGILLERKGIRATVINARFIKPMDKRTIIEAASSHKLIASIEENSLVGGFGSGVLELLSEDMISMPVIRFGFPDRFIAHGGTQKIFEELGLNAQSIATEIAERLAALDHRIENRIDESTEDEAAHLRKGLWL